MYNVFGSHSWDQVMISDINNYQISVTESDQCHWIRWSSEIWTRIFLHKSSTKSEWPCKGAIQIIYPWVNPFTTRVFEYRQLIFLTTRIIFIEKTISSSLYKNKDCQILSIFLVMPARWSKLLNPFSYIIKIWARVIVKELA